jgi:AraC-like DNA-binding protein
MTVPSDSRPLDIHPLLRTRDVDQARAGIAQLFADPKFAITKDHASFECRMNYRHLQSIGLLYGSYGAAIDARFEVMNFFVQGIPIRGRGEQVTNGSSVSVSKRVAAVLWPGADLRLRFGTGFEHLALKIDQRALMGKLEALIGGSALAPLQFVLGTDFSQPGARNLYRFVMLLVEELTTRDSPMSPAALAEVEQAAMIWFLSGNRHNYSDKIDHAPVRLAPWQVRRTEEYIEAHWDEPIKIENLAAITETSVRSLFHFFKQSRGYSPMTFVKDIRLQHAHRMLMNPGAESSVTGVAFTCGFGNLGHFAKDYRDKFGELPSVTLSRFNR